MAVFYHMIIVEFVCLLLRGTFDASDTLILFDDLEVINCLFVYCYCGTFDAFDTLILWGDLEVIKCLFVYCYCGTFDTFILWYDLEVIKCGGQLVLSRRLLPLRLLRLNLVKYDHIYNVYKYDHI